MSGALTPVVEAVIRSLARACERSAFLTRTLRGLRFRGRCRIVSEMRRVPLPENLTADCGGLRYELYMPDDVQRAIYFNCYEPRDLKLVAGLVPPGGLCLDIGANVGFYSLHFANRVGRGGSVYAFEPDPRNVGRLRRNVALNRLEARVEIVEAAVSDREGRAVLHRSDDAHSGLGSLAAHAAEAGLVEVRTTTLDRFLEERGIRRVDLLKADVEGSECELLAGAIESLKARRFRHVFLEFNGVRLMERGKTFADFLLPLETAGYVPAAPHADLVERMRRGLVAPHLVWPNLLFEPRAADASRH